MEIERLVIEAERWSGFHRQDAKGAEEEDGVDLFSTTIYGRAAILA